MMNIWNGKHVLILGAARQGQALTRFLCYHGAIVTLNDKQPDAKLTSAKSEIKDLNIRWISGGHPLEALNSIELVCLSGGIPLTFLWSLRR